MTEEPPGRTQQVWLAFVLTGLAGFVDAVGYLSLDRIYPANMSGNTVRIVLGGRSTGNITDPIGVLVAFVVGVVVASAVLTTGRARGRAGIYVLEAMVLVAFIVGADQPRPWVTQRRLWLVVLAGFAMGLQNASLTRIGRMSVFTTHVTGTLTKCGQSFGHWLSATAGTLRQRRNHPIRPVLREAVRNEELRTAGLFGALWMAFAVGGLAGAWAQGLAGTRCLWAVAGTLMLLAGFEWQWSLRR